MGMEQILLDELIRYDPRPTWQRAINCLEVYKIQNAAIEAALYKWQEAQAINIHRRYTANIDPLNYRDFLVSVISIGIKPIPDIAGRYEWLVAAAWNTKPHPKVEKCCGEDRNCAQLLRRRCICLAGHVIFAEPNAGGDGRSGKHGPNQTLDICEKCRDDAKGRYKILYRPETLVMNVHAISGRRTEPRRIPQVFAHHGEVW